MSGLPPLRAYDPHDPRRIGADVDARNLRVIGLERALATLGTAHQLGLVLSYRDRQGNVSAALDSQCKPLRTSWQPPAADWLMCWTDATYSELLLVGL
jgi:hypothetical protein